MGFLGISGIAKVSVARRRKGQGRDARKGGWTYLGEIQTSTISTVVIVPIHMEDLLPIDRKESGKDTFSQTGSLDVSCATAIRLLPAYKNQYLYISLTVSQCMKLLTSYSSSIVY